MKIVYIHRYDPQNPGDLYSCPMLHLPKDRKGVIVDIFANDVPDISADVVIVGGGALLSNKKFLNNLNHKLENIQSKITVAWGIGYEPDNINPSIMDQFDLFGTRDYNVNPDMQWVPCVSSMHEIFTEKQSVSPTKDFLVVDHFKRSIEFDREHTRIINKPNWFTNVVEQIVDHRFIITSSYHVAYWSTLLGRKCAVIGNKLPGKFNRMKYFPIKEKVWHDDLYDLAQVWPDAREDCVQTNLAFQQQVENLIEKKIT